MSTWGIAFISLGLLLVAYHNWLGLAIVLIGLAMILIARSQKEMLLIFCAPFYSPITCL